MLFLLRKIRRKLMDNKKITSYLLYAIGEIVLVVIGILIAVSLNNWNNNKQLEEKEKKILLEIRKALRDDINDLNQNIKTHKSAALACKLLIEHLEDDLPYHDTLDSYFSRSDNWSIFVHESGSFETLKSHGLDLIKNDSLRKNLSIYYDQRVPFLKTIENGNHNRLALDQQFLIKRFKDYKMFGVYTPWDYEALKKDREYLSWLSLTRNMREFESQRIGDLLQLGQNLILQIEHNSQQ